MAISPKNLYPSRVIDGDGAYPYGKALNVQNGVEGTGTPLEAEWVNDLWGSQQALLADAGIAPNGQPDSVSNSQYLGALKGFSKPASSITTDSGSSVQEYIDGQQFASVDAVKAYSKLSKLIGQRITTIEYHAGTGYGGATYEVVSAGSVTPNDIDIIQGVADSGAAIVLKVRTHVLLEQLGYDESNAGTLMNRAWEAGYKPIDLFGFRYVVDEPILIRKDSYFKGLGNKQSGFIAKDGFSGNVFDTLDFDTLQAGQPIAESDGVPTGFVLEGFYVLGNKDNFTGPVTVNNGYGVRIYGKQFTIKDLRIHDTAGVGIYTELAASGSISNFDPFNDAKPGYIHDLFVYNTGYEGFVFNGPTDIDIDQVFVGWPANSLSDTTYDPLKESLLFPSSTIDGLVLDKGCELGFIHVFDNVHGWGVNMRDDPSLVKRVTARYLMSERCFGQVFIGEHTRYQFAQLMTEENIGGDGSRPHIRDESDRGGQCQNTTIFRGGQENGSTCLEVAGSSANWGGRVISNSARAGHCVDLIGSNNKVDFNVMNAQGAAYSGEISCGLVWRDGAVNNEVDFKSFNCDRNYNLEETNPISRINITSSLPNITHIENIGFLNKSQYRTSNMVLFDGSSNLPQLNTFTGSANVDFSLSTIQTVVIDHNLIRTPARSDVVASVSLASGVMPNVKKLYVSGNSSTSISVTIEVEATAVGTGSLTVNVS